MPKLTEGNKYQFLSSKLQVLSIFSKVVNVKNLIDHLFLVFPKHVLLSTILLSHKYLYNPTDSSKEHQSLIFLKQLHHLSYKFIVSFMIKFKRDQIPVSFQCFWKVIKYNKQLGKVWEHSHSNVLKEISKRKINIYE